MKIKHNEIAIPASVPFSDCKLNREQYATILTEIVSNYSDGFVLAINNEWGTGKTTFVKMWQQQLINEGFQSIYFNAWENDFNNNPLVALMSELQPLTKGKISSEKIFKSALQKGALLTKHMAPALIKSIVNKYVIDTEPINNAVENATKAATEILEQEVKEYTDKKKTIKEFRNELEAFIETTDNKKPLVFIVDELDRCRPNYSVEVLEQLKHFFSVKGIVFVLSIDKNHLASSIKGFYGSDDINTDEYLRRFIDLEYSIPKPSTKAFCNYLYHYYEFDNFFRSSDRAQYHELRNDAEYLIKVAEILFNKTSATLRQQEKIFALTRLILNSFKHNQYTYSHLLFFLIYLKTMNNDLYQRIEGNALTVQELCDEAINIMPVEIKNQYGLNLVYVVALLLHFYNNMLDYQDRFELLTKDDQGNQVTTLKMNIKTIDINELVRSLQDVNQRGMFNDTTLKFLTSRINLTESLAIR